MYFLFLIFVLATLLQPPVSTNQADGTQRDAVNRELTRAFDTYPNLQMLKIGNAKETIRVPKHTGLTVADIRGVPLDNPAPRLVRKISYERRNIDRSSPGSAPYMSPGILPFRLDHFNCEFNYGGRHNYLMQDYASLHGFNMIHDYRRTTVQKSVFPTGTGISKWKGIEKFRKKWFQENGLRFARYDQLQETHFENSSSLGDPLKNQQFAHIMLDMEHPILAQANLKKQNWYPPSHRSLFEKTYYENYARTLTSTVAAYRLAGFKSIGIYGWQPFPRSWITMLQGKELPRHGWETYGKKVYGSVDVIHNSVYCPYLNSRNVAFVLASIDENVRRAKEMDVQKPVRPYFWPLISGGGSGYRWWRELPHPNEDQCAMIAMSFFYRGLTDWSSGTGRAIPIITKHRSVHFLAKKKITARSWSASPFAWPDPMVALSYSNGTTACTCKNLEII